MNSLPFTSSLPCISFFSFFLLSSSLLLGFLYISLIFIFPIFLTPTHFFVVSAVLILSLHIIIHFLFSSPFIFPSSIFPFSISTLSFSHFPFTFFNRGISSPYFLCLFPILLLPSPVALFFPPHILSPPPSSPSFLLCSYALLRPPSISPFHLSE